MLLSAVMLSGVLSKLPPGLNHTRVRCDRRVGTPTAVQIEMRNDNDFWNSMQFKSVPYGVTMRAMNS